MKSMKLVFLFVAIILAGIYMLFFNKQKESGIVEEVERNQITPVAAEDRKALFEMRSGDSVTKGEERVEPELKRIAKSIEKEKPISKKECVSYDEFEKDPANLVLEEWMKDNLMMGDFSNKLARYAYASEQELIEMAKADEAEAMWALAINYRWYSHHENFQSMFLKPTDQPMPKYVKRPLDIDILNKSRYWFEQAAIHGLVSGYSEILYTYDLELAALNKVEEESSEAIAKVKLAKIVNLKMMERSSPEYFELLLDFGFIEPIDSKILVRDKKLFDELFAVKQSQWAEGRVKIGKEIVNKIQIPTEVIRLSQMAKELCPE